MGVGFDVGLDNTALVLVATALLGLTCGVLGTFTVLRGRSLLGDALAHATLPGICLAYLIVEERHFSLLFIGALSCALLSVWCIVCIRNHSRLKEDTAIAITLSSFFGLGIALSRIVQNLPHGNRAGLDDFIFGKAASIVTQDLLTIAVVALGTLTTVAVLFKEFTLLCFDREFAWTQGYPVRRLDLLLMCLVCLCAVAGLPAVGVVLVSALLIFPAVTARLWSARIGVVLLLSGAFGLAAALLGTSLSTVLPGPPGTVSRGLPTGPLIVLSAALLFVLSLLCAPQHGAIARLRRWRRSP